jgi:hypothetical protein
MSTLKIGIVAEDGIRTLYTLEFGYVQDSRKLYANSKDVPNLFIMRGTTKCNVRTAGGEYVGWGEAWCYRKDVFDPKKGERISLGRALKLHPNPLQKPARAMIWQQYFAVRPIVEPETEREKRKRLAHAAALKAHEAADARRKTASIERRKNIVRVVQGLEKLGELNNGNATD